MAGDPFEDAFKSAFDAIVLAASPAIDWRRRDVANTEEMPSPPAADAALASAGWFEVEFIAGDERQYTSGSPGANLHLEQGQITIRAVTRLRAGGDARDLAGLYLDQIRAAFRARTVAMADPRRIRIVGTMPMGDGENEAGNWVRALGLRYELFNVG